MDTHETYFWFDAYYYIFFFTFLSLGSQQKNKYPIVVYAFLLLFLVI